MRRALLLALLIVTSGCVPDYGGSSTPGDAAATDASDAATSPGDASDAAHAQDSGNAPDASDAGPSNDAGDAGISSPDAGSIVCHSGGGASYTYCAEGSQACCGVFAAVPDFCVPFPDTNNACQHGTDPVALVSCVDPSQCSSGDVCCAANLDVGAGTYSAIACAPQGVCTGTSGVACGTTLGAPNNAACTGGKQCTGMIDLYRFCQ